ncbi:hypothetical protein CsSME_00042162 [Camellia sinensis var. sinensis]
MHARPQTRQQCITLKGIQSMNEDSMQWCSKLDASKSIYTTSIQNMKHGCYRRSARVGLLALERGLHTPSFSCPCKTSAGVISTLERVSLRSSGGARAAGWFSRSSGCALFLCLGARAGLFALERT